MSIRNLQRLLRPSSVAVIGASNRVPSLGQAIMSNVLTGGIGGPVMPVNPHHESVAGVLAYPSVKDLPVTPDLAVVCTPARSVPGIIGELGERGCKAAVVLSGRLRHELHDSGVSLQQAMLNAARPHLLRIIGPNCLGVLVPGIGLNASFAPIGARPGRLAMVHQSGPLGSAALDWAASRGLGFSHFVSLGDSADVDFGDLLDYLGTDRSAHAILLYMESLPSGSPAQIRKFMSAARAASRHKPVLVVKAGRVDRSGSATASRTAALAGFDRVYDAAFARAGMLRVYDSDEMIEAVETLAFSKAEIGERLAILTNGEGPGLVATDALVLAGGTLAQLAPQTVQALDEVLPPAGPRSNPIDIGVDADSRRYVAALELLLKDPGVDTVLVLHASIAMVSAEEVADGIVQCASDLKARQRVFPCVLGGHNVSGARRRFADAQLSCYRSPDGAVRGLLHRVRYHRNQALLMETPPAPPARSEPDRERAIALVREARRRGDDQLSEPDAKQVLAAYGIPVVETRAAASVEAAVTQAEQIGYPVALKILSADIDRKSDVGGVRLDLDSGQAVEREGRAMLARITRLMPEARVGGFTVQAMARRPCAHELIVGVASDPVFGPVVLFGEGGTAVEVVGDTALALPPLNVKLAHELMSETRIWRRLQAIGERPPANLDAITDVLLKISRMVVEIDEMVELDINPLLADEHGVIALDARIRVASGEQPAADRLVIRPYPKHLEEVLTLGTQQLMVRPIRPEDEPAHARFLGSLDARDIRFRFFGVVREFAHTQLARFTQIDYDREMAFIAERTVDGEPRTVGVVRAVSDPDGMVAEFAIVIGAEVKGLGLGRALMLKIIGYCRSRGMKELEGDVLSYNQPMLGLARSLGFQVKRGLDSDTTRVSLALNAS